MLYKEFLILTKETAESCPMIHYDEVIEPKYLAFDGLSKQAFCKLYLADKANRQLTDLRTEMAAGFKSEYDMLQFHNKAQATITKINNLFKD